MPQVGEIKIVRVKETRKHIWVKCPICQEERWMQERNFIRGGSTGICLSCYNKGEKAKEMRQRARQFKPRIVKNGVKDKMGYILIRLQPDDFFYPMVGKDGYVREHRLVMAKYLGRNLHLWEAVHHKNHIRDDNRKENLQLISIDSHNAFTRQEQRIEYLEKLLREHSIKF